MIGHDADRGRGGGSSRPVSGRGWEQIRDDALELIEDVREIVWSWVETVVDVVIWVRVLVERLEGVAMERWHTQDDERTCPQCGGLDGQIWAWNAGEFPPAHTNCRCRRVYAFTEWTSRPVSMLERRNRRRVTGGWLQTGWS